MVKIRVTRQYAPAQIDCLQSTADDNVLNTYPVHDELDLDWCSLSPQGINAVYRGSLRITSRPDAEETWFEPNTHRTRRNIETRLPRKFH